MGSNRKHKKHKEKDKSKQSNEFESNSSEQKPLRLVLKVPTVYSSSASTSANTSSLQSNTNNTNNTSQQDFDSESPPKLMAFSGSSPQTSVSSSLKKMKKKKSKKKHRKHSHHHSRHRHHSHHRRHRGSCSYHSRQSQDSMSASLSASLLTPNKSPQKSCSKSSTKSQFQQFLSHLLKQLQRKDIQQFFAWPVSDMIAPGYSTIISHPMDLSSMKQKIDQNIYETLLDFKADVKLICDNCMKYNRPETVYYKAASKLWHYTRNKLLNKDLLIEVIRAYPGLSSYELGFCVDEPSTAMLVDVDVTDNRAQELVNVIQPVMTVGDTLPMIEEQPQELHEAEVLDEDGLTPEQILEEAKKAAQMAANRLTLERPNGANFSFLRQRSDGSTTLSIVGNHSYEQNINLESLAGKLNEGTASLNPFKESESNRVKPIESINESPFCSYLPSLDSSKATLSEEDSALLLSTYGDDEFGLQYAQSITQFAHETDYVLNLVDSLLDILTHGQHNKIAVKLRERHKSRENESQKENNNSNVQTNNNEIQVQLNETGSLIGQLESLQYQRLSSSTQAIKPSLEEEKLANQLSTKLTDIIGNCSAPKDVSDVNSIRKAMGIKIKAEK